MRYTTSFHFNKQTNKSDAISVHQVQAVGHTEEMCFTQLPDVEFCQIGAWIVYILFHFLTILLSWHANMLAQV